MTPSVMSVVVKKLSAYPEIESRVLAIIYETKRCNYAITQVASCWILAAEARVRCCLCSCGICGWQIGIKVGLSLNTWSFLSFTIPSRGVDRGRRVVGTLGSTVDRAENGKQNELFKINLIFCAQEMLNY
jgi:hypothetical protein